VYAAIRQGKAKTGMAEELARRIKEGAIPIISDVPGFMAYYVVYAPDDTVSISIFNNYEGAEESNKRVLSWPSAAPTIRSARCGAIPQLGQQPGVLARLRLDSQSSSPARSAYQ